MTANRVRFDAPFWGLLIIVSLLVSAAGFLSLAAAAQTESASSASIAL